MANVLIRETRWPQRALGALYMNGEGVSRDYANGLKWISRPLHKAILSAQLDLGTIYQNGLGVPQDYVIAHMWFNLASAAGSTSAGFFRDALAASMTPGQIAEAQQLARDWKSQKPIR